jgi:uncharacterized protein (TIGR00661 family)
MTKGKIIVAPLNWGLGHATRCIPVIKALIEQNFTPIIASDGVALQLLRMEFPSIKSYQLPSYGIQYPKKGKSFTFKLLLQLPKIYKAVKEEHKIISKIIEKEGITGIISDNRFGVYATKVPSVYITHQVNVLSGFTTFFSSKVHQKIIAKFDYCWIPDYEGEPNLAGKLSHVNGNHLNCQYINPISRFHFERREKKYDLLVLLSGPEPQRTLLEEKLLNELKSYQKSILFIRGIVEEKQNYSKKDNLEIVNYMLANELENAINESEIVLARSGYSTIMDLDKLGAKAFFIPTPGQFEQEYLAKYLKNQHIANYARQESFKTEMLVGMENYTGFLKSKTSKSNTFDFEVFI